MPEVFEEQCMELYELTQAFTNLLQIEDVKKSPERLMEIIQSSDEGFFDSLTELHDDLTADPLITASRPSWSVRCAFS